MRIQHFVAWEDFVPEDRNRPYLGDSKYTFQEYHDIYLAPIRSVKPRYLT